MSENPFLAGIDLDRLPPAIAEYKIEALDPLNIKRERGRQMVAEMGLAVGDQVRVTWEYSKAYGSGIASHEGTIAELGDYIVCKPISTSNGILRLPLTAVKIIQRIEKINADA